MELRFVSNNARKRATTIPKWLPSTPEFTSHFRQLWTFVTEDSNFPKCPFTRWQMFKDTGHEAARLALKTIHVEGATPTQKMAVATTALREVSTRRPNPNLLDKLAKLDPDLPRLKKGDDYDPMPKVEEYLEGLIARNCEPPEIGSRGHEKSFKKNFVTQVKSILPSQRNSLRALEDGEGNTTSDPPGHGQAP